MNKLRSPLLHLLPIAAFAAVTTTACAELSWDAKECSATARFGEAGGQVTFICRNSGTKPIALTEMKTACSCASVRASKTTLAAGESAELSVTLHFLGGRSLAETHVTVATDDGATSVLTALLRAAPQLSVTPSLVSWPRGSGRTEREMIVELADGATDGTSLRVLSSDPRFQIATTRITGTCRWKVKVQPPDTDALSVAILTFETQTGAAPVQRAYAYAKVLGAVK